MDSTHSHGAGQWNSYYYDEQDSVIYLSPKSIRSNYDDQYMYDELDTPEDYIPNEYG